VVEASYNKDISMKHTIGDCKEAAHLLKPLENIFTEISTITQ
jgi:hypothetical protein